MIREMFNVRPLIKNQKKLYCQVFCRKDQKDPIHEGETDGMNHGEKSPTTARNLEAYIENLKFTKKARTFTGIGAYRISCCKPLTPTQVMPAKENI